MENMVSLESLSAFYRDKRIFVTGHTGFKGAWLVATLHLLGANVRGYSLAPEYRDGLFDFLPLQSFDHTIADIRDREQLSKQLREFQPQFIFHLAAQPLVRRSYRMPSETFEVNVVGTANLLEGLQTVEGKCTVVVITTDKVYENREQQVLYAENDLLGGYDPYSASKACAEIVVSSFRNSFFHINEYARHQKGIVSVRAGNVIGGGDWSEDRLVPDIVRALQAGREIAVRNPGSVRPWQHVLEPIGAYLALAARLDKDHLKFSQPYNIGPLPSDHLSVRQLVEQCIHAWGSGSWVDISGGKVPHEAGLLQLSIEKIQRDLSWQPRLSASEAIAWTMAWYRQPRQAKTSFTFDQIRKYFES